MRRSVFFNYAIGFVEEDEFPLETTARRIHSFPPYDVDWPEPDGKLRMNFDSVAHYYM